MKRICITNHLTTYNEFGTQVDVYVNSVWGDSIDFEGDRWHLRDSRGSVVTVGNVCELHGDGQDDYIINLKNIVRY